MRIPAFTADVVLRGEGGYSGRGRTGNDPSATVAPQTAPGFYYGGQFCDHHVLWDTWTEVNGGAPVHHDWPVGSC